MIEFLLELFSDIIFEFLLAPIFMPEFDLTASPKFNGFRMVLTSLIDGGITAAGAWLLIESLTADPISIMIVFVAAVLLLAGLFMWYRVSIRFFNYRRALVRKDSGRKTVSRTLRLSPATRSIFKRR